MQCIADGSWEWTISRGKWTRLLDHWASHSPTFKIRSYLLAHAYNKNLNNQEGNATYLSPHHRCGRMILAHAKGKCPGCLYGPSASVGLDLVWWKPRSYTAPLSAKLLQDLKPSKDLIYVYEDVIILYLSFEGPPPFDRSVQWSRPTRNSTGLRQNTGRLNGTSSPRPNLYGYTIGRLRVVIATIKMTLQNPGRLLTSWSDLDIRRTVPLGRGIYEGLPLISHGTRSRRLNLQNSKKFRHQW